MQEKGNINKVSIGDFIKAENKSDARVEKIVIKDALESVSKFKAYAPSRSHDQIIETKILSLLGGVIVCSFVFLLAASYNFDDDNPHAKVLAEYSQAAGTTSLGALVVLLSGKRNKD